MCKHAIVEQVRQVAEQSPDSVALIGTAKTFTYQQLIELIDSYRERFRVLPVERFAIDLENGPAWAVIDLALMAANKISIPVPAFFSQQQLNHLLKDAAVEWLLTTTPERYAECEGISTESFELCGEHIQLIHFKRAVHLLNASPLTDLDDLGDTVKITYTSGTTGEPKGVCVGAKAIVDVVRSIALRTAVTADDRHLSVLPLTTLLENVGGLYVSLVSGATVVLLPQNQIGLRGASGIDTAQFIQQFERQQPTTTILIPQMVQLLVTLADLGTEVRHTLRFAAVGGAPISETLLQCALELGFPIYEGYGLSESTSVVAFNAPNENRVGSVGRPLPHIELKIAEDGEVWVRGSLFNGYLGGDATVLDESGYLPTGDLGTLDDAGFLTLKGRKKSLLTTAYGRNVAPEWVERELVVQPGILQAALFGNGKPSNLAVVVATAGTDVAQRVAEVNRSLPDYAQVGGWILADEAFTTGNGQWTGTARPRRAAIWAQYGARIEAHYQSKYKIESKRTHGEVV